MSVDEAVWMIENMPLNELGKKANERKKELHPKGITTFVIDNINYTNICFVDCKFWCFLQKSK